jgi:hypothetical protein
MHPLFLFCGLLRLLGRGFLRRHYTSPPSIIGFGIAWQIVNRASMQTTFIAGQVNTPGDPLAPRRAPLCGARRIKNYFFLVAFFLVAFFFAFFLAAIICPPPFGIPHLDSSGLILKQSAEHRSAVTSASIFPGFSHSPVREIPRHP